MKTAEIIAIGSELLCGQGVDSNSAYLAQRLTRLGIYDQCHCTVGDEQKAVSDAIRRALKRSDIVITTGGLGPTSDDITLQAIARGTHRKLLLQKDILKEIRRHFKHQSVAMPLENIRQAYIPAGSAWIHNLYGTAPGLIIKLGKKILIALPGVPAEFKSMMKIKVEPFLKAKFSLKEKSYLHHV